LAASVIACRAGQGGDSVVSQVDTTESVCSGTYFAALSLAYRLAGQYNEAVEEAKKAVEREPKMG